jgi:type I restriction enzyme S subunit
VDFDPVRAKADGRDPGLPRPLADLFPDRLEDSERGEIPAGWQIKSIGDLADVVGGTTPSTKEPAYWDGETHAWATPKDLSGLSVPVLLDTERRITDAGLSQIGSGLLPKGTVLLSSRAPIGYLAIAEVPVAINQGFIAMAPKTGTSNLFLLLWASVAHEEIVSRANGSTFLEISKANFRPIPVVTPSAAVMRAFEGQVRRLYERIVECEHDSRTLAALRDALLPKLISGELRVPFPSDVAAKGPGHEKD